MSLSYGLNVTKKASLGQRPAPPKRKTIFDDDDDSGPEDGPENQDEETTEPISAIGGLQTSSIHSTSSPKLKPSVSTKSASAPFTHPLNPPKTSQQTDLSTKYTANKHSKAAQELDPTIYDYDAVYDSLHAKPPPTDPDPTTASKPKYMTSLLAAAEVRKRDQLRAKEKMLTKEREAEGDEFKDKEQFVTGAYKRQQEELRKAEEEEKRRAEEEEERKRVEGGGMRGFYRGLLGREEERHREIIKAVEEGKGKEGSETDTQGKTEKTEEELAREKGAVVNEEGVVVDKRELLSAGLNAVGPPKKKSPLEKKPPPDSRGGKGGPYADGRGRESARDREIRSFGEQLLGKRGASHEEDGEEERAAKSRRLEDELLGLS